MAWKTGPSAAVETPVSSDIRSLAALEHWRRQKLKSADEKKYAEMRKMLAERRAAEFQQAAE